MPIDSQHPKYKEMAGKWAKCRDVYDGSDAVKDRGVKYLPKLSGQTDEEYRAYRMRALFYNTTSKTVNAQTGISMQKPPIFKYPARMEKYFTDVGGLQMFELWKRTMTELNLVGRIGVLVDSVDGGDPFAVIYPTEAIINWRVNDVGDLIWLVLAEQYYRMSPTDPFEHETVTQYRHLALVNGQYQVTIYNDKKEQGQTITPVYGGKVLDYIPFYVANPFGISAEVVIPPMADIVEINLSHYMSSADLEHGRHFTGLPTPVAIGVEAESTLRIGSMTAWNIPDPQGDAKYLEFTGQGLQSLENAMKEKQSQMASMSARFLDNSTRGSESPDTVRYRYSSETASLATVVMTTETLLNLVYKTMARMMRLDDKEVVITLNKDFISTQLNHQEIKELVEAHAKGRISTETLVFNLRRGERLDPKRTDAEEIAAITQNMETDPNADNGKGQNKGDLDNGA